MDFLKRNSFMIGSGLAAVAGIALGVLGLQGMPKVKAEMENAQRVYQELNGLQSSAANRAALEAQEDRIAQVLKDRDKIVNLAKSLYGYEPLVEGVFPDGPTDMRLEFREKYGQAIKLLYKKEKLHWGTKANASRIDLMKDKIADEQARAVQAGKTATSDPRTASGVLTFEGVKANPPSRAHIQEAQKIYMYLTPVGLPRDLKLTASLDLDETMSNTDTVDPPLPEDCWFAQLNYWIQKDVVEAIKAVNDEAAEQLKKLNKPRWVGSMPIKDIVSVRVTPFYIPSEGDVGDRAMPGESGAAEPAGTPTSVFTGDGQSEFYDVIQFTVKLIMDQRDVPLLIEKLTTNRFHTLLRVAYKPVPPNRDMVGKIYGSEPVVIVVLDFETIFLGEVFRPMMPFDVCESYGIECPQQLEEDEADS